MHDLRKNMRLACYLPDEVALSLMTDLIPDAPVRVEIASQASLMVEKLRAEDAPSMMELFLSEYGLSSEEGVALMCLAEALLRVPDAATMDTLIEDKIAPSEWGKHLGESHSNLVFWEHCVP